MKVKVFTLRFCLNNKKFETKEFDDFVGSHEIINVREQFFENNSVPYWAILVCYHEKKKHKENIPVLNAEQQKVYDSLKKWRIERAQRDHVSAYMILHDKQLYDITQKMPLSLAALQEIRGVGKSKCQQYGTEVLEVLNRYMKEKIDDKQ